MEQGNSRPSYASVVGSQKPGEHYESVTNDFMQVLSMVCSTIGGDLECIVGFVFLRGGVGCGTLE
jgi:hypothetical protein